MVCLLLLYHSTSSCILELADDVSDLFLVATNVNVRNFDVRLSFRSSWGISNVIRACWRLGEISWDVLKRFIIACRNYHWWDWSKSSRSCMAILDVYDVFEDNVVFFLGVFTKFRTTELNVFVIFSCRNYRWWMPKLFYVFFVFFLKSFDDLVFW